MNRNIELEELATLILSHNKIMAFTGAGISTDSGIPDLKGISAILGESGYNIGIFEMLNRSFATSNPTIFYELYRKTFFQPNALPNFGHRYLAMLEEEGKLLCVATMNIDCLHQKAGSKNVYEYWGNMRLNYCSRCEKSYDWDIVAKEQPIPICGDCGGVIIPDFVLCGLGTYPENIQQANRVMELADLIIIAGTRQNRREFPSGTLKIIINMEEPTFADQNTLYIKGNINSIFQKLSSYSERAG